jgi:hypothetical protein
VPIAALGTPVTVMVSGSPSMSIGAPMPRALLPESSATVTVLSASAAGASLTGVTVRVTVWLSLPPLPSSTV